eukprot:scaffold78424_cov39-Cyclotella_meneghiniana.AAC.3
MPYTAVATLSEKRQDQTTERYHMQPWPHHQSPPRPPLGTIPINPTNVSSPKRPTVAPPPATAPAVAAASVSYPYRSGTFHLLTDVHLSQRELSGGTVLLVDRTGGGKSHIMRCSGAFTRGIAVIIVPLLALAAEVLFTRRMGDISHRT